MEMPDIKTIMLALVLLGGTNGAQFINNITGQQESKAGIVDSVRALDVMSDSLEACYIKLAACWEQCGGGESEE